MYRVFCCVAFVTAATIRPLPSLSASGHGPPENMARGCAYTMQPAPNYSHCTDAGDATQLTDGVYTQGYFWTQSTTVGWQGTPIVLVTVDLGETRPISGVSFSTAAGQADVAWPKELRLAVSEDGRLWRSAGDLVVLSQPQGRPPAEGYGTFRYASHALASRGRYVRLAIVTDGAYAFCDELEIYRGPDTLLAGEPTDPVASDPETAIPIGWSETRTGIFRRLSLDLHAVRAATERSPMPTAAKNDVRERLKLLESRICEIEEPAADGFRTIFPLNATHAAILATRGAIMRAEGWPEFFVWRKHRFDPVQPGELPARHGDPPALQIAMMRGEYRADACLLTNASEHAATARVQVEGLPGAPRPSWLAVSAVPWTDTAQRTPVAAALPDAAFEQDHFVVPLPPGTTTRLWLTIDSSALAAGEYAGTLVVEAAGHQERLPLTVRVSSVTMPPPRLSLGMWDYTDGSGTYGITEKNRPSAIASERSHFVDSPWAKSSVLPWPTADDFDAAGNLKATPSFQALDAWMDLWPHARNYLVFAAVGTTFAGAASDAPQFAPRVGSWAAALAQHMRDRNLQASQLGLLLVDEPYTDEQDATIIAWAEAIKAAAPELTIFQDPCWLHPQEARLQRAITLADIVCPQLAIFYAGGPAAIQYYQGRREAGQRLWFYQCSGPPRLFDPCRYYRRTAWHAFRHGATGIGFWSFADTGGGHSSWNEYAGTRTAFTPAFIGIDDVTDAVHWQAVREGIEDYEYLGLLRDAAARTPDVQLRERAERLLDEALDAVTGHYEPDWTWAPEVDREIPDAYRLRVLELLERMP